MIITELENSFLIKYLLMTTLKLRGETVWLGSHPPTALPFQEPDEEALRRVILRLVYMLLY